LVAYHVGGRAEPIERYGPARVGPARDLDALTAADGELLSDAGALSAARGGAERARAELTWEAAAVAHLALYRELA
jgi:glycosyltransferase involved in cell wall biosynthesis